MPDKSNFFPPVIVVLGQTGTGKSSLAMFLAQRFNGDIVAADSRTIYQEMDIGTAKPTKTDQSRVRHYGLDAISPDGQFSAADFQKLAYRAIDEITSRGRLPILVGGTGLYIDGLIFNFSFRPMSNPNLRRSLTGLSVGQLQQKILSAGLSLPADHSNPRRLQRLLESGAPPPQNKILRSNTLLLGLRAEPEILFDRLTRRVDEMVLAGLVKETEQLLHRYGGSQALLTPGYRAFTQFIHGELDLNGAKSNFVRNDMQLAKRQLTWFKRNKYIHWLPRDDPALRAEELVFAFLNTTSSHLLLQ